VEAWKVNSKFEARNVLLDYGSGGKASHRLIGELFLKYLGNEILDRLDDAAFSAMSAAPFP
jgi:hydrogenase expression/formation protein HypE